MNRPVELDKVTTHHDVDEIRLSSVDRFEPRVEGGVSKYAAPVRNNGTLRALLVNKATDTLVVALHGATNRAKKELPRFEWFRTLRSEPVSSLYFSDPALELEATLELAWYTGRLEFDMHAALAEWIRRAAGAIGASRIVILGSSGGGFAALQVGALVPSSLALPFSPQTAISKYLVAGAGLGAQRKYLKYVMPELAPEVSLERLPESQDWASPLIGRLSSVARYREATQNFVYYVQNLNDRPHLEQHCEPFRTSVEKGPNRDRVKFDLYEGPVGHNPPSTEVFRRTLHESIAWHAALLDDARLP